MKTIICRWYWREQLLQPEETLTKLPEEQMLTDIFQENEEWNDSTRIIR